MNVKKILLFLPAVISLLVILTFNIYWYGVMQLAGTRDLLGGVLFWVGNLVAILAFIAKIPNRRSFTKYLDILAYSLAFGVFLYVIGGAQRKIQKNAELNVGINERYLAEAFATAPCNTGDTAILKKQKIGQTDGVEISLQIIPKVRTEFPTILAFTSPVQEVLDPGAFRHFLERTGAKCQNAEYASLAEMYEFVKKNSQKK